ncbi:MAG TPA: replication-associated recombination protein A [Candidatus Limnocylindrales bacterium]|nr:replication-associated recombination protein A [Candidatus Limnocylindrales bacterium]
MAQESLFPSRGAPPPSKDQPLAARMRPRGLDEFVGQEHLVGPDHELRRAIEEDRVGSMILWGPPGSGKTTLARLVASATSSHFVPLSAVSAGVADLRRHIEEARVRRVQGGTRTILFIDEIHRFNKGQQDAVLPFVEEGVITLIGATTENPSFEVNAALLSRTRVFVLRALDDADVELIVDRAMQDPERGYGGRPVDLDEAARAALVRVANGDARVALNGLEAAVALARPTGGRRQVTATLVEEAMQRRNLLYDRAGEEHYNIISALHKSLRDSDPDGSLYWLGRMLEAGEDPLYVARRLVRFASEDVGMADPAALQQAVAAQQAAHFIGMPEANLALAQAVVYLATAPKSNALYAAYSAVREDVERTRADPVPLHLRNAPTPLMKQIGYGRGYKYAHDYEGAQVDQQHLPDALKDRTYYHPTDRGYERTIRERRSAGQSTGRAREDPPPAPADPKR